MAECWALNPQVALHWRHIDGEWLVYECLSGGTHIIDHVSAAVLTCFETHARLTMDDLCRHLITDLALDVTAAQAAAAVQQFSSMDLLLPAASHLPMHAAA